MNKRFFPDVSRYLAPVGFGAALLAGIAELVSGPGTRLGIWQFQTGLVLFGIAGIAGAAGAAVSLIAGIVARSNSRWLRMAVAGFVIGMVVAGIPWSWKRVAAKVPSIHDITTDTKNPPSFVAILPLRRNAPDPASYGGPAIAEQQLRAYPDIRPLTLPAGPDAVFDRAMSVARNMGWKIVSADPKQGRIEATATTFWFGFKDDIVVRIEPEGNGSRVDVRSVSRVGVSDIGTNAKRVRTFLNKMKMGKKP